MQHVLRNRFAEMCYQDDIRRERMDTGQGWGKEEAERKLEKEVEKKKGEESRRRAESAQDRCGRKRAREHRGNNRRTTLSRGHV